MRRLAFNTVVVSLVLVAAACSGDDAQESSTTTSTTTLAPVTSLAATSSSTPATTSDPTDDSTTTSAAPGAPVTFPEYTIYSREQADSGDTLVVLLDPDSYVSLTDIDLANVLADVVDRFPPPILTAYVVDDEAAAAAVLAEDPTEEELELLNIHYLVRLEEGFRMVFAGPFSDSPVVILGS